MTLDILAAAARLLAEFGDARSAERAAGARAHTACNAVERGHWQRVQALLRSRLEGDDAS